MKEKNRAAASPMTAELLAPAGSLEAFFAALESGADAVYCGLQDFSARAKAKNFSMADLGAMIRYAHERERKVFLTLNTLIKEAELPALVDTLAAVEEAGVDAVIVQDLAVWRLARDHFPALELHASTQMTVHNSAGVRQLEKMGFERAVLSRELTLPEIAHIRSQTRMQLEHFIHGALCFCFSGQCYFSSYLGGKSGNRGRCTQPCRRRYTYRGKPGYYFSPNDLSAIELLPALQQAGVSSFKIEGRMKSAEYVANVVAAYRQVMDASPEQRPQAVSAARQLLKQSFGRSPTKGFLSGAQPADMATPALRGSTGRYLGDVSRLSGQKLYFSSRDALAVGDRIRVQPGNDQVGTAFTLKQLWAGNRPVKQLPAGAVCVENPFGPKFKVGDAVFKVSSQQAFSLSDAASRRRLQQVKAARQPLQLQVQLQGAQLHLLANVGALELESVYQVEVYAAADSPLTRQTLEQVFAQSADAPFTLAGLQVGELPQVVIPPKRLKEIRRDFYQQLGRQVEAAQQLSAAQRRRQALDSLLTATSRGRRELEITVAVRDAREMRALENAEIDRVVVPLTAAVLHHHWTVSERQRRGVVWDVPMVVFDQDWPQLQQAVQVLVRAGFCCFRLNNLSHFELFAKMEGLQLETGYRLFCVNSQAMLGWQQLGASGSELYIEDDQQNMQCVLSRAANYPLYAMVYGSIPLITSRIRIPGVKSDLPLVSDRGDEYRVINRGGLSVLHSQTDFSLCAQMDTLQQMGCAGYLVDISHLGAFSNDGRRVMEAVRQRRDLPGTAAFNFEAGLE